METQTLNISHGEPSVILTLAKYEEMKKRIKDLQDDLDREQTFIAHLCEKIKWHQRVYRHEPRTILNAHKI